MEISVLADSELSAYGRNQIDDVCDQAFGSISGDKDNSFNYQWVLKNDWHVIVKLDGVITSHVGIVERIGTVDGKPVRLGGVGAVATLPNMQKKGLASAAMDMAAGFMQDSLKMDFGLLLCAIETEPFYRRLGWQEVTGPLVFDQPQGKVTFHELTMVLACVKQDWPPGIIDLRGLPW